MKRIRAAKPDVKIALSPVAEIVGLELPRIAACDTDLLRIAAVNK